MISAFRSRRTVLVMVTVLDVIASLLVAGWRGAVGAGLGVVILALFFLGGRAPSAMATRVPPAHLFLLVALGYLLRVVLLLVALAHLGKAGWLDGDALGVTLVLGALAWSAFLVHQQLTSRQPTLVIARAPTAPAEAAR